MKKLALLVSVVLFSVQMLAQSPVSSAAAEYQQARYNPIKILDAKKNIDKATTMEKYAGEAKTWYYKGVIYKRLHEIAHLTENLKEGITEKQVADFLGEPSSSRNYRKLDGGVKNTYVYELIIYFSNGKLHHYDFDNDEALRKSDDDIDALDIAYKAYQKSVAIDPSYRGNAPSDPTSIVGIKRIASAYYNEGIVELKAGKNEAAFANFESAITCYKVSGGGSNNTNAIYYAGLSASGAGKSEKAIEYLTKAQKLGIQDVSLFRRLASHHFDNKDYDKAIKVIQDGRKLHPKNQNLMVDETNVYLKTGQPKKAIELLNLAIESDPTNHQFHYAVGTNYDELKEDTTLSEEQRQLYFDLAVKSYESAVKIKPDFQNAVFNLGVLYYNEAASWYKKANNLPLGDPKYDEYIAKSKELFKLSLPHMENYHKLDPKDVATMKTLVVIYQNLSMPKEMKEMKAKADAAGK